MSVKEKRVLRPDEQVDHIDENPTNDDITNLQLLTLEENVYKNCKTRCKKMVLLKCPNCDKVFSREKRNSFVVKGGSYSACSRHCAGKFSSILKQDDKKDYCRRQIENNLLAEYEKPFIETRQNNTQRRTTMKIYNVNDINKFFNVIDNCKGKVELVTGEGDRLNLKSKLCQYVALADAFSNGTIPAMELVAYEREDVDKLMDFMAGGELL